MKRSLVVLLLLGGGAFPVHAQTLMTLGSFNGTNGANPFAGLIADAAGNLFGTTNGGGTSNVGTVFEIAKTRQHLRSARHARHLQQHQRCQSFTLA